MQSQDAKSTPKLHHNLLESFSRPLPLELPCKQLSGWIHGLWAPKQMLHRRFWSQVLSPFFFFRFPKSWRYPQIIQVIRWKLEILHLKKPPNIWRVVDQPQWSVALFFRGGCPMKMWNGVIFVAAASWPPKIISLWMSHLKMDSPLVI